MTKETFVAYGLFCCLFAAAFVVMFFAANYAGLFLIPAIGMGWAGLLCFAGAAGMDKE